MSGKKKKMEDCGWCNQTRENCECHIPFEKKHRGLIQLVKEIIKEE